MTFAYQVDFRGFPACPCLAAWLPVYEAELHRRGILTGPLHIYQLIGGAAASAGTHTQGGAFDVLDLPGGEDLVVARQMGADATWSRPVNWDGQGGMAHIHGVLTGCPHNGPARYQIDAVRAGFNGLGYMGHAAPDTGPRPLSGRTWQEGIQWAKQQGAPVSIPDPVKAVARQILGVLNSPTAQSIPARRRYARAKFALIRSIARPLAK